LYNRLITPVPQGLGWEHQTLCAILDEKKKKTLWPAVWNYEALMKRRSVVGSIIFENQYMNRPTAMEGDVLRAERLHAWNETDHTFYPPHNLPVYAGIDPSLGENDFFSVSTLAMDRANNRAYLLDVWCEHLSFNEIIDQKLPELFSRYRYQKMYLETNFWQKLLLKYPNMQTHAPSGVAYPIVPIRTVTSKTQRFIPLSSHFESRRVLVNPRLLDKNHNFFKQWVEFPRSEHDDAVDSTEMVVANAFGSDWELPDAQVVGGKFNRD
jgi:predicted phage terminase large subunit-like protein